MQSTIACHTVHSTGSPQQSRASIWPNSTLMITSIRAVSLCRKRSFPKLFIHGFASPGQVDSFFSQRFAHQNAQGIPRSLAAALARRRSASGISIAVLIAISIIPQNLAPTIQPDTIKKSPLTDTVPDILARIVVRKREELAQRAHRLDQWERQAESRRASRRDFRAALQCARVPAVIAEVKKASPSKGILCADFDPARIAAEYHQRRGVRHLGAHRRRLFPGQPGTSRSRARGVDLPVLRKDFRLQTPRFWKRPRMEPTPSC